MRIVLVLAVLLSFPISPSLSSNEKEAQDPMSEILDERKMENQLLAHFHRQAETKFEQGRSEASSLYRKATSTTSSPADYYTMGVIYYKGRGVRQSDEEALRWWARAAARHHAGAAYSIAVMHHNGRAGLSQAESDKESFSFMRAAADEGHAKAMYNLGLMFTHGKGVGVDERKAARWFGNAANEGLACAQFELSLRYRNGVGIDQNLRRANSWHRKAISQGLSEDQLRSYVAYKAKNYNAGVTGSHEEETREEGSVGSSSQGPSTGEEGTDDANRLLPRSAPHVAAPYDWRLPLELDLPSRDEIKASSRMSPPPSKRTGLSKTAAASTGKKKPGKAKHALQKSSAHT